MSSTAAHSRRLLLALAVLLIAAGGALVGVALSSQDHPPQPPVSAAASQDPELQPSPIPAPPATSTPPQTTTPTAPSPKPPAPQVIGTLEPAAPVHLDVPAIGVSTDLLTLGLNSDGTIQVPTMKQVSKAGWYRYSPTPGELGPSVIVGHVDSAKSGPGVFFRLGALRPGDVITVSRADHTRARFRVARVASYSKKRFPTSQVYGNTKDAELRLITCGGAFDTATGSYLNNVVVYASLAGSSP